LPKKDRKKERENMCRKTFILGIFLCVLAGICFADKKTKTASGTKTVKTYGDAIVEKITGIDKGFVFRCNIKEWPAVIARNIPVRIDRVGPPQIVTTGGMPNKFFESQLKKYLSQTFAGAQAVRLENIKRGRTFSIVADVIVDSNSVADLLIAQNLARPYAKGQKPQISTGRISEQIQATAANEAVYVASKNSKVFHRSGCRYAKIISDGNLVRFNSKDEATQTGRKPCKTCNP